MTDSFRLGLRRPFRAEHALVGGDWGPENSRHFHDYLWEVRIAGSELNPHGYLLDLVELEAAVDSILSEFEGSFLNDLPDFCNSNPSLERFCRLLGRRLVEKLGGPPHLVESILWENDAAWASWTCH